MAVGANGALPQHRQQFVDFRVVVYRLYIPGTVSLSPALKGLELLGNLSFDYPFDAVMNADFGDQTYADFAMALSSKEQFSRFLTDYHNAVISALTSFDGTPMDADEALAAGIFQEIDITPLVKSANPHIDLYGMNQCTINMMDPHYVDFDSLELSRFSRVSRFTPMQLNVLRGFQLREFDLVRVFSYADVDVSPTARLAQLGKIFPGDLANRFLMSPAFTGVVNTIARGNEVGSTADMTVGLLGVERLFSQSVTVFNDNVGNVITDNLPTVDLLADTWAATEGRFAGQKSDSIIVQLFSSYIQPFFISNSDGNAIIGAPDLKHLFARMFEFTGNPSSPQSVRLIPMLPTVVLLHILKKKYGEPIMRFDDRVEPVAYESTTSTGYIASFTGRTADAAANLEPYLLRFRDAFGFWSASYQSAGEIFQTIKDTTFMELFEDRTGEFRMRFPRYNSHNGCVGIPPEDVRSAKVFKTDSAIYSAEVAKPSLAGYGVMPAVSPQVYIDKLSVLKFGLRQPQISENPNAVSDNFAKALAAFQREYFSARDARRGSIVKLIDPTIGVGQLVLFSHGSTLAPGADREYFVGYVITIDENYSVGGECLQTLGLAFVRPATRNNGSNIVIPGSGSAWDIVNNSTNSVASASGSSVITADTISETPKSGVDIGPFIYNLGFRANDSIAGFRDVSSVADLAILASHSDEIQRLADLNAIANGTISRLGPDALNKHAASWAAEIKKCKHELALIALRTEILKEFSQSADNQLKGLSLVAVKTWGDITKVAVNLTKAFDSADQELAGSVNQSRLAYEDLTAHVDETHTAQIGGDDTVPDTAAFLNETDIGACLSFADVLGMANIVYAKSFQGSGLSFLQEWSAYFNHRFPGSAVGINDVNKAISVMARLAVGVQEAIDSGKGVLDSHADLNAAYKGWFDIQAAIKKASNSAVSVKQPPSTIAPLDQNGTQG